MLQIAVSRSGLFEGVDCAHQIQRPYDSLSEGQFQYFRHSILIARLYCVDYGQQELCRRGSFKSCVCGRCGAELRVQPEGNSGDAPSHVEPTRCIKRRKHLVGLGEVLNKYPELPVYAGEFADVGGSFLSGGRRATRKWSERSATATRSL